MQVKKFSAVALSALMATTAMLPMSAFAQQTPSVEYTGGDGSNITHLYLIANDENLANNNTVEYNQTNAKVQVPVAINYVAQANGNITGPADEAAQIRNFSGFPVNVANIKVNAGTNVTLVNTAEAADTADEIYLQMKPNSGTTVAMADFTASATEVTSGQADGTGKRPDAGTEWNIAAAVSGVGTSSAVASVLNLNSLSGKIGGFNLLNPAAQQEIGQIEWTVKAGTYANPVPALPANQAAVASTSLSDLSAIGDYLRSGNADASYVSAAEALVGATMDVTLKTGTMTVRLADVSTTHGLTFEAVDILTTGIMNPSDTEHPYGTNEGGWTASALRTSMNSGTIYTTYFEGTALNAAIHEVSNTSYDYNGGNGGTVSSSDSYWVPSMNNVFGSDWWNGGTAGEGFSDGSSEMQFDYYARLDPAVDSNNNHDVDSRLAKNNSGSARKLPWWLRSAQPYSGSRFMRVGDIGDSYYYNANTAHGVAPCFCL